MRKYNFTRPLLIIGIALIVRALATTVCLYFGASEETASNIAFAVMMVAVIFTFMKMNKLKNRR